MANKRMFSKDIINTDRFQSLKLSAQALYFHLGLNADDDGFVGSPLAIVRCIGSSTADLKSLADNGYLIPFSGGVYLITDWRINNYIRGDRYRPTIYQEFYSMVCCDDSQRYVICQPGGIPMVDPDKVSIDKSSSDKNNIEGVAPENNKRRFCPPSVSEVREYCLENDYSIDPDYFVDFYNMNGWKVGRNPMKDWKAAVRTWVRNPRRSPIVKTTPDFSGLADEISKGGSLL